MVGHELLDDIWVQAGRGVVTLGYGRPFWHCGNFDNAAAIKQAEPLWGFASLANKLRYAGHAKYPDKQAWVYEARCSRTLKLASFGGASLSAIAVANQNSHEMMKMVIFEWLTQKRLDGIIGMNGNHDEIVVNRPTWDLDPVSFAPL